ncbi:MAG: hypothetical protein IPM66_01900 [Acidobacteriota bacterium]|nr:MAG: hypothetical protein IPM66_01900 [Acidobacteriota bacterium]
MIFNRGAGLQDVTMTLTGGFGGQTTTTSGNGNYSFNNVAGGYTYTVTPSKSGWSFTPTNRVYPNLSQNKYFANFTATPNPTPTPTPSPTPSPTPPPATWTKNVNYDYNSVGALSGVGTNITGADPNATTNVLNTTTFRASGAIRSVNYGNGRRLTMGYNANRQQPVSMKVDRTDGSDTIVDYAYDYYDANGYNNGRIRKITDNVDPAYTTTYTYDAYNRLTQATASAYTRFYAHDAWGNIKNFSWTTFSYATNASGAPATSRIATATNDQGTVGLSYDAAGNLTQDGSAVYNYDAANRLKEVGVSNTSGYDGDGMRVRQSSGGAKMFNVACGSWNGLFDFPFIIFHLPFVIV